MTSKKYDYLIIGGGIGGLYTAYKIKQKQSHFSVCIVEKENRLGGRIFDVNHQGKDNFVAIGGRRINSRHTDVLELSKELGIELQEESSNIEELYINNGLVSKNPNEFLEKYELKSTVKNARDFLYQSLVSSEKRQNIKSYDNFKSYAIDVIGKKSFDFLRDTSRFKSDFDYDLNPKSYLDYLDEAVHDTFFPGKTHYAKGGLSSFIRKLNEKLINLGVDIYTDTSCLSIDKDEFFKTNTDKGIILSEKVILALPPHALNKLQGNVVDEMKNDERFKALLPIPVLVINQWYEKPFWKDFKVENDNQIWRIITDKNRLNHIEIPQEEYVTSQQNVIRVSYNDNIEHIKFFKELVNKKDGSLEAEVEKNLKLIFENETLKCPIKVPKALRTEFKIWDDAWYFIRSGNSISNNDILNFALNPIDDSNVSLISEAYNLNRLGWSSGAIQMANHYLEKKCH